MKRSQIYLTKEQEMVLKRLSKERRRSMADLIREALDLTYLRGTPTKESLAILSRTAGAWGERVPTGEDYVEELRGAGQWSRRLAGML